LERVRLRHPGGRPGCGDRANWDGTNDQVVPVDASSRLTAKGIAHATLLTYKDAPNGLFATHKARLTTDLLDFLKV